MANGTIHNTVNLTYLLFNAVHNLEREVVEKICIRICVGKERARENERTAQQSIFTDEYYVREESHNNHCNHHAISAIGTSG